MDIDPEKLLVRHNEAASRFEVTYKGRLSELVYQWRNGAIAYLHTGVPPELEGHGIAGRLAEAALKHARAEGLTVLPLCPYVRSYIERHAEYADLVSS